MNTFIKKIILALTAIICSVITSCESDNSYVSGNLIGTWKVTHSQGYIIEDGERNEWSGPVEYDYDYPRLSFRKDHTADIIEYNSYLKEWDISGTVEWSLKGDILRLDATLPESDEFEGSLRFKVLKLSSTEMILRISGKQDGVMASQTDTYKKIESDDFQ